MPWVCLADDVTRMFLQNRESPANKKVSGVSWNSTISVLYKTNTMD